MSEVIEQVEELLNLSIIAGEFAIAESHSQLIDLSQIDFEALKKFPDTPCEPYQENSKMQSKDSIFLLLVSNTQIMLQGR